MSEQAPHSPRHQLNAEKYLRDLVSTDEFDNEKTKKNYPLVRALARSAAIRAGMSPDALDEDRPKINRLATTPEARLDRLVGALPTYIYGLEGMRHHFRDESPQSLEFQSFKHRVIRFNHSLKALLEADHQLNTNNLVVFVTDIYGVMNSNRWGDDTDGWHAEQKWFKAKIEQQVRGMQHEVIAGQIIKAIGELTDENGQPIEISVNTNVTINDERHGVDMFVTLDGVTFPIDIKASERTAQNVRDKSPRPNSIITTGVETWRLRGALHLPDDEARNLAPDMLAKLRIARDEYLASLQATQNDLALAA